MALAPQLLALALAAQPEGKVVEQVVAVIRPPGGETRVVTLTKLTEEARIAMVSRGATEAAVRPLDGPALKAALDWYVDQTLLFDEAARLRVFEVERGEGLAELARFRQRFARPDDFSAFLRANDLSEEDLAAVLRRMLRVQRYVDGRVARAARVTEAEAEEYFRRRQADFPGLGFAQVRPAVVARLAEERVRAEVKELVTDLRARSEVRVLVRLGPGA